MSEVNQINPAEGANGGAMQEGTPSDNSNTLGVLDAEMRIVAPLQSCTACEWIGAAGKCPITDDGERVCLSCGAPVVDVSCDDGIE